MSTQNPFTDLTQTGATVDFSKLREIYKRNILKVVNKLKGRKKSLILDKKKFDCRLYVLIRGVDPVEAFLCTEGLARFCTHNYKKPDHANIKNLYMHLTNFSLNKNSQKFKAPGEQFQNDDKSSK